MQTCSLAGLELGCAKCHTPLGQAYNPDQKMRHLCRKCAAKQRADNIKAFEAHRASRSDGWPADRRDHAGSADSNPRPKIGNVY